jgi:hypothetical protein
LKVCFPLLALIAMAGCQKGAPAASNEPTKPPDETPAAKISSKELIDFQTGSQWVFTLEATGKSKEGEQSTEGEFTMKVTDARSAENGLTANIQTTTVAGEEPKKLRDMTWRLDDGGLFQVADNDNKDAFDPPMPLLPDTLEVGQKVGWKGTGPRIDDTIGPVEVAIKVIGPEEVDTLMGRMSTWCVESAAVWKVDGQVCKSLTTTWWSPKVGLVRMNRELDTPQYGLSSMLRLKSHTVKE